MLIAMTGAKGSGKDTFAKELVRMNFFHTRFADPLKNMIRSLLREIGLDPEEYIEGALKEVPLEILGGKSVRYAMQTLGTEWRDMIDRSLWTNIWRQKVEGYLQQGAPVIVTDCRFLHESRYVRELGGVIIRVDRPGLMSEDRHISEQEMYQIEVDQIVVNDGTIEDLHNKARNFLRDYLK